MTITDMFYLSKNQTSAEPGDFIENNKHAPSS